jgi:hypothetical protein
VDGEDLPKNTCGSRKHAHNYGRSEESISCSNRRIHDGPLLQTGEANNDGAILRRKQMGIDAIEIDVTICKLLVYLFE